MKNYLIVIDNGSQERTFRHICKINNIQIISGKKPQGSYMMVVDAGYGPVAIPVKEGCEFEQLIKEKKTVTVRKFEKIVKGLVEA